MQLYNPNAKYVYASAAAKNIRILQTNLFLQAQTSAGGGAAPSASFPPSAESGPASDSGTSRRLG
jgi:hypothetical protein